MKYYELYRTTNEKFQELTEKYNNMARYNDKIEEIYKDRDDRIQEMRDEMQELMRAKDEVEAQLNSLKAENSTNIENMDKERQDMKEMEG